ncbi:MAG: hypothetical protein GXP29_11135, partial [Planctomycetes bacterium]|nr:hypothetical protein [Planctomycetota bacterium]
EMQDVLAGVQSAHHEEISARHKETSILQGDIAVLKEKFGLAEGMSSARLDELVALKDESAKRAEKLGGQLAEQTKAFERMTAKQEEQLAKRAEDIRKMNQQAGVLKEDLQQARFLSDARLSRTDKVTEFIRRSAARSIGYAEGMRQHLVYRDRMENRLRRELAQLHSLKGEPADSTNHRAGIWSSTVDDDEAEASTLEDGDVSIGTIFKDCFNTWLFGRDDVSAFASASSKTANAKP